MEGAWSWHVHNTDTDLVVLRVSTTTFPLSPLPVNKEKDNESTHSPGRSEETIDKLPMLDEEGNWDMFIQDEEGEFDETELLEQEPAFEMAMVEIDVNEALGEMEKILTKYATSPNLPM